MSFDFFIRWCGLRPTWSHSDAPGLDQLNLSVEVTSPTFRYDSDVIPTEPIGSIPRPSRLIQAIAAYQAHTIGSDVVDHEYSEALQDTIDRLEKTGSPVLTDGEQTKPSFATYPLTGLQNLAPDGVVIPF